MAGARSKKLFEEAKKHIPGGVNSPVRAFRSVGGDPIFIKRAKGSKVYDADGKAYIDYVLSWGPAILGHAHPKVTAALKKAIANGTSFGAPTELEITLAKMVKKAVPSIELVRMVSSGTEATMSAIRVARGFTGRDKILKFDGCYHGHGDSLLVKAGSGVATFGLPDSPGVPADLAKLTLTVAYNDLAAVRDICGREGERIACIIVEPVVGNMGCVPPEPGFLEGLRQVCDQYGIVLIFDEVMTGFRVAYGGAQQLYKIKPDLTTLGKVIGGGLPVGRLRRQAGDHGKDLAPRAHLPGGHAVGQSPGHDRRHRDPEAPCEARRVQDPRKNVRRPRKGAPRGRERSRHCHDHQPRRLHVHHLLHGPEGEGLRERQDIGHGAVREVLPCPCSRTA